jgi:superfamily II DNA or RNA helicase
VRPHLQLRRETLVVPDGTAFVEVSTGVIELRFEYEAGGPDAQAEADVRRILEGFGPIDLSVVDDCAMPPGASADYAVHLRGDPAVLCAFSTHAVPRMRALGWAVEIADDYPARPVHGTWYADLAGDDESDWFELELGVVVDGERVDLLPVLLDLIADRRAMRELLHGGGREVMLPIGDRSYLSLPPQRLRSLAHVLAELYEIEGIKPGGPLRLPSMIPAYFEGIEDALGEDAWTGDAEVRRRAKALSSRAPPPRLDPPRGLQATLRPYQQQGLAFLQHLRAHGVGGILADDMGLGKTLQAIAHIVAEKESGRMTAPALVVAPTSLVGNWRRELARFAPGLLAVIHHGGSRRHGVRLFRDADVIVTTYGLLARDEQVFADHAFHLLVLDEAQTIKNPRSQAHRLVKDIDAEHRLCLTGTPMENNLDELWALFDFAVPGLLGNMAQFRRAFRHPIERDGNAERMETLRDRVRPFILRRLKDDVAGELPPKTEIVRVVELSGDQRDLYESIRVSAHATVRKAVRKKGIAASTIDILGALMKLRQACCDPRLVPVEAARQVRASAKFTVLFDLLQELLPAGRRVLVFSQFTSMLALVSQELAERRIPFCTLTGASSDRQGIVDEFQSGAARVFLISLKAGGTGLNLTAADTVIHYDPWWNPAAQAQATDRAYRIGQTKPVFVYNLIVAGSVEERMLTLQARKKSLADGILQSDPQLELSLTEVDDLFAPLD